MKLTEGDLLAAIQEAVQGATGNIPDGPEGVTTAEAAMYLEMERAHVCRMLSEAVRDGKLVVEKGIRRNILGDIYRAPVYRPAIHE